MSDSLLKQPPARLPSTLSGAVLAPVLTLQALAAVFILDRGATP